uniref:Annexin n=1 Tax=Parascaris equorum TaxID=6256 RepID=A0A914RH36_PAREQ
GIGTKEYVLIDIICTRSNEQLDAIKTAYEGEYGRSLDRAIKWDTSGDFERLLIALLQARPSIKGIIAHTLQYNTIAGHPIEEAIKHIV